jgi:hypothetical protein
MASSAFSKALASKKAAIQKMNEVEHVEYKPPVIPEGIYILAVDAEAGVTEKAGAPYVKLNWTIQDAGEEFGKSSNSIYWLDNNDEEQEAKTYQRLSRAFQALLDLEEVNVEDATDIEQLVDMVNDEKTYCTAKISSWQSKDGKKTGFNVYFKKRVVEEVSA